MQEAGKTLEGLGLALFMVGFLRILLVTLLLILVLRDLSVLSFDGVTIPCIPY